MPVTLVTTTCGSSSRDLSRLHCSHMQQDMVFAQARSRLGAHITDTGTKTIAATRVFRNAWRRLDSHGVGVGGGGLLGAPPRSARRSNPRSCRNHTGSRNPFSAPPSCPPGAHTAPRRPKSPHQHRSVPLLRWWGIALTTTQCLCICESRGDARERAGGCFGTALW